MHEKFVLFGTQHLIVMALTFAIPAVLALVMHQMRSARFDAAVRTGFAAVLIGTWIAWYVLFISRGWLTLGNALPMNLCDWTTIAVLIACIRPGQKAFELAYFWALAGTMQGLVTPDVNFSFPEPQFVVFLLGHGAIIAAVIYLTFGTGLRPVPASILRAAGWSLVYAAAAGLTDWLLDVNYGFFRAKPGHATVFDFMPAWPAYIPEMIALGILATVVLYAPWFVADLLKRPKPQAI
ncbi:MAG TPA: TIGR02206 family membrane protein [Rhizomicrobium sp.]|nr:TIGR02206 family membrane protein [Rhizomicrobium sp.]